MTISLLQRGDIVLSTDSSLSARLIRRATNGEYSHVAICYQLGALVEAQMIGVRTYSCNGLEFEDPRDVRILRLSQDLDETRRVGSAAADFASQNLALPYARVGALLALFKALPFISRRGVFCSQLVAKAYDSAGMPLFRRAEKVVPGDFVRLTRDGCRPLEDVTYGVLEQTSIYLQRSKGTTRANNIELKACREIPQHRLIRRYLKRFPKPHDRLEFYELIDLLALVGDPELDAAFAVALRESGFANCKYNVDDYDVEYEADTFIRNAAGAQALLRDGLRHYESQLLALKSLEVNVQADRLVPYRDALEAHPDLVTFRFLLSVYDVRMEALRHEIALTERAIMRVERQLEKTAEDA